MQQVKYLDELVTILNDAAPLSQEAIGELLRHVDVSFGKVAKGQLVQESGVVCRDIIIVRKGIFRNFILDDGRDLTRWFAIRGDIFTSMLSWSRGVPTPASVEAVTKAEVWTVSVHEAKALLERSREWRDWLLKMMIDGMAVMENRDKVFISEDAYTRFKNFYSYRPLEITNQIPLKHLASYLRITQQTLCRCRRRLAQEMKNQDKKSDGSEAH